MIDITSIAKAVLALLAAVVSAVLVPLIRSKTTLSKRQELMEWITIAVSAAEQIYQGSGRGAEKKMYVQAWLRARNIVINDDEIDAMIESAVHDLKTGTLLLGEAEEVTAK